MPQAQLCSCGCSTGASAELLASFQGAANSPHVSDEMSRHKVSSSVSGNTSVWDSVLASNLTEHCVPMLAVETLACVSPLENTPQLRARPVVRVAMTWLLRCCWFGKQTCKYGLAWQSRNLRMLLYSVVASQTMLNPTNVDPTQMARSYALTNKT